MIRGPLRIVKKDGVWSSPKIMPPNPERDPKPSSRLRTGKRVLLADDDPLVRESLNDVLVDEGYIVVQAENGQQAIELANSGPVDLVLLDLNMPVKNGWDTFERLTAEHPLIPVIIITARPNQLFTSMGAGAGALMEKPMDIPTLLETMDQLLVESPEQRLARLAGKSTAFLYKPATPTEPTERPKSSNTKPVGRRATEDRLGPKG